MDNSFPGGSLLFCRLPDSSYFRKKYNKVKKKSQYILIFKIINRTGHIAGNLPAFYRFLPVWGNSRCKGLPVCPDLP
ncbi:MAG: hypothetical protein EGP80_11265 [Blautia wexlerae]|nr:hypothetical protein [Blautia wexlerae]